MEKIHEGKVMKMKTEAKGRSLQADLLDYSTTTTLFVDNCCVATFTLLIQQLGHESSHFLWDIQK